ncbi:MAG: hypothetical protein GY790_13835, partial [Bacteroidetes bacterium]|nr:hypothetical protein [Bacteroidota bacterium]
WDPVTGKTRELPDYKLTDGLTTIPLEFFPHESYFVIFPRKDPESPVSAEKDNFPDASPVTTLDGSWQVSFDPEWGGPEMVMFDGLYDWSMSKNDEIKYYSGIATYRKAFDRPESLKDDSEVWLDLGTVHEIARVRLNGKELGVVWSAPWRIDISAALKPGSNTLEIELANLWPNRLIGDAGKPEDQQFTWTVRHHYTSKSELMPSGLLGPVRLLEAGEKEERNDAVNHILSLRDKSLKNGAFDIEYFSSDDHFPYATDWMYQDMKEKIHLWFAEDDNSEIKDEVIDKFKPVLGDHIESGYEKLKKGGKISDKDWLVYYFDLCQERRAIRLATIPEKYRKLVFTKHFDLGGSHYAYTENPTDAPGSEKSCDHPDYKKGSSLCIFTLDGTYGKTEVIESTESGVIRDPDVSYDGKTILYSKRESRDQDDYHIYEYDVEAKTSRQLTFGLGFADVEPAYLPNGNIIFNSTRCVQTVDCFWPDVTNLYLSDADGNHIRRVGYDQVHTNYPKVMDNGKVIYTRWDYNDRAQIFPQPLFEMNMDGTRQTEYYGNNSFFPTAILHARGLPGTNKVLAVLGGHHAHPRGKLAVIDPSKGRQEADGVQLVAPIRKAEAERVDAYGQDGDQFQFPYPIDNENFFITYCAYHGGNRNYPRPYGIYWMNMDGERELLVWDAKVSCNQQMPLASRIKPPERPSLVDYTKKTGIYHVKNVYEGPGLEGIEKGTVKELRVVEILYRQAAIGLVFNGRGPGGAGHSMMPVAARHGTWDAKKVWGSVPVYEDGSSLFEVPARTPFYFQLIDSLGDVVQTMRSWSTLQPGEFFSCVGCHEDPNSAPVMGGLTLADKMGVQKLKPFYDVEGGFSFNRVIQPILDDKCISCHDGKKHEDKYLFSLTSEQYVPGPNLRQFGTDSRRIWSASYMNLTSGGIVHPKETVLGWLDVMETPAMLKPYYAGSAKSRMMKMLRKGHSGVTLSREELDKFACWIDLLVPYCGDYDENTNWTTEDW